MSRAASTIVGGMFSRLDRTTAAEYSFLAAVPIMFAATAKDLYESRNSLCTSDIPVFAVGFVVSFIVAVIAIKTFIKLLGKWTLKPFAYYRLVLSAVFAVLVGMKIISLID
jgi:undecaprenyl-diphosphatase